MKTKIEKGLKYLAAGLFFIALVLNMKITLEDPFIMLSDTVVAQTTSTTTSSMTSTGKTKTCREVGCSGTWKGTADLQGCITVFGKKYCNYSAHAEVTFTYFGKNENCTGGSDWYDCDACQKTCVPTS